MNFFGEVLYIDFLVSFMQNVAVALYLSAWIENEQPFETICILRKSHST